MCVFFFFFLLLFFYNSVNIGHRAIYISITIYSIMILIRTGKAKRCITTVRFASGFNVGFNQNSSKWCYIILRYNDLFTYNEKRTYLNIFYAQFYPQFTKIINKYLICRSNGHEYFDWFASQGAETFNTRLNTMDGQVSNEKKKKKKQ